MKPVFLNKDQAEEYVFNYRIKIKIKESVKVKCLEERIFENKNLIGFNGGVWGTIALVLATANAFGFTVKREKIDLILRRLFKSKNNWYHRDCFFIKDILNRPSEYHLFNEDIDFLAKKYLKENKTLSLVSGLFPSAFFLVYGKSWTVLDEGILELTSVDKQREKIFVFVFHQTIIDNFNRRLVAKLSKNEAVTLYPGCDEDYLYQVLSLELENFLFEGMKNLFPGVPIFNVSFEENGKFKVEEMGSF